MSDDHLYDLVIQWDQRRQRGEEVSPELLCQSRPELLSELEDRIASVIETDWMLDSDDDDDDFLLLPDFATLTKHADETVLPSSRLSVAEFAKAIADSGLLSSDEIEKVQTRSSADDATSLARELVSTDKLTTYQASALLKGRSSPLLLDRYIILDTLDRGGMGLVFKALHRSLDRIVALKTLPPLAVDSPDKVRRFQREARAAAKLHHANIVTTHDAHESNGVHFLVMEYVKGQDLNKVVNANGPLPVGRAVNYILQTAKGLEHAHKQGIIHRDIKPANLLLGEDGVVKVLDMGLARIESGDDEKTISRDLTMAGTVMGTVAYMSPEQAADSRQADHRSDIYSLGCTLYFLLTGKPPYQEGTSVKTIFAHRDNAVPALSGEDADFPEALVAVYHRMLAKQPDDRFQSMTELIAALEACPVVEQESATQQISGTIAERAIEETVRYERPTVSSSKRRWISAPLVWRMVTISALLGFVAAAIAGSFVYACFPAMYRASALMRISSNTPNAVFPKGEDSLQFVSNQVELIRSRLVLGPVLRQPEIARMPELNGKEDPIAALAERMTVSSIGQSDLFQIAYTGPDPARAAIAANAVTESYFRLRGQYEDQRMQRVIELLDEESQDREQEVGTLRDNVRALAKQLRVKDPFFTGPSDVVNPQQHPLANLVSQITTSEAELTVLKAQMQAYQEWMETQPIVAPEGAIEQTIEQHSQTQKLKTQIALNQSLLSDDEAVGNTTSKTAKYQHLQREIERDEKSLEQIRENLKPEVKQQLESDMKHRRLDELQKMSSRSEGLARTVKVLRERYEQLKNVTESSGDTIELEFKQAELARAEQVLNLIEARTMQLRTERRAPRVELLESATPPSAPLEEVPYKEIAVASLAGFCFPFLCSGLAVAVIVMRRQQVGDLAIGGGPSGKP